MTGYLVSYLQLNISMRNMGENAPNFPHVIVQPDSPPQIPAISVPAASWTYDIPSGLNFPQLVFIKDLTGKYPNKVVYKLSPLSHCVILESPFICVNNYKNHFFFLLLLLNTLFLREMMISNIFL